MMMFSLILKSKYLRLLLMINCKNDKLLTLKKKTIHSTLQGLLDGVWRSEPHLRSFLLILKKILNYFRPFCCRI